MAHITSIGAGIFTDLSVAAPATPLSASAITALNTADEFQDLFVTLIESVGGTKAAGTFIRLKDIREFPAIGVPPNIVNVPVFGSATSHQVQGQSDAPTQEIQINYIPAEWSSTSNLGMMVGDGVQRIYRFVLMNAKPLAYDSNATAANGIGSVQNSQWYIVGKLEAIQVNPQLTDANTATITLSTQSAFFGAFTE